jgi:uncharacterized membrane protein SpoIIM required for sporulation
MKQEVFEARYTSDWETLDEWIQYLSDASTAARESVDRKYIGAHFPGLYRKICHHLSLARARRYSIALQDRLNRLALDGHQHLYRGNTATLRAMLHFLAAGFPAALRRKWRYFALASVLFYAPLVAMILTIQFKPALVYSVIDPSQVRMMEEMYDPANSVLGRERESDTDFAMFGHYIFNNIGIGFRTFAGGLLFSIGSIFFLLYNGLFIGAVAGHLGKAGFGETFWPFVAGHSSFELTAIVIFGAAGLMIGFGALAPGRRGRWQSIRFQAREAVPLIYGGTIMLVVAAFIEAFWSSTTWPPPQTKYIIGGLLWALVILYFSVFGRRES